MAFSYSSFVSGGLGKQLASSLGLPQPSRLRRHAGRTTNGAPPGASFRVRGQVQVNADVPLGRELHMDGVHSFGDPEESPFGLEVVELGPVRVEADAAQPGPVGGLGGTDIDQA